MVVTTLETTKALLHNRGHLSLNTSPCGTPDIHQLPFVIAE